MVAAQRALAHRAKLIDDPLAEPLVRAVRHKLFTRLLDGEFDADRPDPEYGALLSVDGIVARTRFFDRVITDAVEAGVRQIVILASGLDTRAYRLPWPEGSVIFEVDQPKVIESKARMLADLGVHPLTELRGIAIDLRDDWPTALIEADFDRAKPTAWIAEGLLIYLPPQAQDRLFDNLTELSASGSRMATEFVPDMKVFLGDRVRHIADRMQDYGAGLDVVDLVYHGERRDVVDYLGRLGWETFTQTSREILEANGFDFPDDTAAAPYGNATYVAAALGRQ